MKTLTKSLNKIICAFGILLPLVSSILVLNGEISPLPLAAIFFGLILYFIYSNRSRLLPIIHCRTSCVLLWGIVIFAILARTYPLLTGMDYICQNDLSDTGVHYYAAQELFFGGLEPNIVSYEKVYPFLMPYTVTLSCFNYLLNGHINLAIIVSNTCFDLLGCLFCYLALRRFSLRTAKIGAFLWIVNPFSIVMCWLPLNIVVVNMLLSAAFYSAVLFFSAFHRKKQYRFVLAGLFGLAVFAANTFRPVFTVFMIAFVLTMFLTEFENNKKDTLIAIVVAILLMAIPTGILHCIVKNTFGEDLLSGCGGWNFYVGSNYDSYGQWTREDCDHFFGEVLWAQTFSPTEAHKIIKQEAVQRYLQLMPAQLINHFANKASVLFSRSNGMAYDLGYALGLSGDRFLYRVISSCISLCFGALTLISSLWMVRSSKRNKNIFFTLCYMGLFAAFLLVEVMNRYSSVFYAMFVFYAAFQLTKWFSFSASEKNTVEVDCLEDV